MAKKQRQAKISYCYDRLWEQKLSQVYHLLVPGIHDNDIPNNFSEPVEDTVYENSSHLYQGVLGSTKRE